MILQVMRECKNYFGRTSEQGEFKIENGIIDANLPYLVGQYILISGSVLNDGVYIINDNLITLDGARDEIFCGVIYGLAVPNDFLDIANKIEKFSQSSAGEMSNVVSASFGIQSTSFGTNSAGVRSGWKDVFRNDLHKFRRPLPDIMI